MREVMYLTLWDFPEVSGDVFLRVHWRVIGHLLLHIVCSKF